MAVSAGFPRCSAAATVSEACAGLADDLVAAGCDLPSIYLLSGPRLRCHAARGYFQVIDGFPAGTGIVGEVVAKAVTVVVEDVTVNPMFIAAVPGLRAEACCPIVIDGVVVGAVNLESRSFLRADEVALLEAASTHLATCLEHLGGLPAPSAPQRLAQVAVELTSFSDAGEIEGRAALAAVEISSMSSAALVVQVDGRLGVSTAHGPLAAQLRAWRREELDVMASWVAAGTSSHFPGGDDVPPGYEFLRATGVRSLSVHPMVAAGQSAGLLLVADEVPVAHTPAVVECLELLAAITAASLGTAVALQELARRADHDGLTGLRNATAFAFDAGEALVRGPSGSGIVLIDVDRFKEVNDGFGHLAGDQLLVALAHAMRLALRAGDTLYRIGGDEFAAVIRVRDGGELGATAQRLLMAARRVRTTVSIGTADLRGASLDEARRLADAALYAAKAAGRDGARHASGSTRRLPVRAPV